MKRLTVLGTSCFLFMFVNGQDSKDYAKMKEEVTSKVFENADPYFKDNKLPDQYKNESAIILAQKQTLESDSKYKLRFGNSGVKFNFYDIFRRKILINDRAALDEFSQLSFTKLQSKNWSPLGKMKNYTFLNIRIIKPGGTIKTINVDESQVTLRDDNDEKKSKIAIPDLGIGDIIDYYVCNYYQLPQTGSTFPLTYIIGDDYPVVNYVLSLQFDTRIAAEYQAINGAPDFKISNDDDGGGNVLNMAIKNVPKIKGLVWSSTFRQLPIIRLNYRLGPISRWNMSDIKPGRVEKANSTYADMLENDLAVVINNISVSTSKSLKGDRSDIKSAWKDYITKNPKADKPDSIAPFVFRYLNWEFYYSAFSLETNFNAAYFPQDLETQIYRIIKFANVMQLEFKQDIQLLILTGTDSYTRNNAFRGGDLSLLVSTVGSKPQYFSFADNLDDPGTVPYTMQGEKAKTYPFYILGSIMGKFLSIHTKEDGTITLPNGDNASNAEMEFMEVSLDPSDPLILNIKRKISEKGHLKKEKQASLAIYKEIAERSGSTIGKPEDLVALYDERGKTARKSLDELKSLLIKAEDRRKDYFENELTQNFTVKPKELKSFRILNLGMNTNEPFEFDEEFSMEGWVKKAGNNYLMDIGKLLPSQIQIEKDQRERTQDIYMPFPRSFSYHIEFTIPAGYTAEGLDKINSVTENETGGFTSSAKVSGEKLIIDLRKYYVHSMEPSAKWPLMLNFLDKAVEFGQAKILLKKK